MAEQVLSPSTYLSIPHHRILNETAPSDVDDERRRKQGCWSRGSGKRPSSLIQNISVNVLSLLQDEVFEKLKSFQIDRRRITLLGDDDRQEGGFGVVRRAHLYESPYLPSRLAGTPQLVAVKLMKISSLFNALRNKRVGLVLVDIFSELKLVLVSR